MEEKEKVFFPSILYKFFFLIIRAKKEKSRHLQRQKNSINDDCTYERLFSTGKIIKNMSPEGLINCGDLVFIDCNSVFIFSIELEEIEIELNLICLQNWQFAR